MVTLLKRRRHYTSNPVSWSKEEVDLLMGFAVQGKRDWKEIHRKLPNRTQPAIKSKLRKLRIEHDLFGESYRAQKDAFLKFIADDSKANTIFDAYAGSGRQTFLWSGAAISVYASERNPRKQQQFLESAQTHLFIERKTDLNGWLKFTKAERGTPIYFWQGDAVRAAASLSAHNRAIDLIDLDTCGTTLPTISTFLALLRPRHLVVTFGEFHSCRFGREDVLRRVLAHRDVNSSELPTGLKELATELRKAAIVSAMRAHNEIGASFWLERIKSEWLTNRSMLREYYRVDKQAAADCLNKLAQIS